MRGLVVWMWNMFVLKNEYGNYLKRVETEREMEALLDKGYTLVEKQNDEINFDKMRVSELEAFAKSKGIDLSDCKNREDKLAKIKEFIEK